MTALAFALSLPLSLLAFAWGNVLFSSAEMTDVIADELIDSGTLQELAVDAILGRGTADPQDAGGALDYLARQDLNAIFASLIPPNWARSQIESNLQNLYAWIDNRQPTPQVTLDVQPIKDQIERGGAQDLIEAIVGSWPDCSLDQIDTYAREGFVTGGLPEVLCQPPEPLRSGMVSTLAATVEQQVQELPSTVRPQLGSGTDQTIQDTARLKRGLRLLRGLAQVGWMLPISALGLITALAVRSWPQLMRWWGVALSAAGLLTFLSIFASGRLAERAGQSTQLTEVPLFFGPILRGLMQSLFDSISMRLLVLALFTTILGLLLLVPGLLLKRSRSH